MFTLHNGDCLQVMPSIPSGSIDAIITDLPYGTTACKWDTVIEFAPMWKEVKRVLKPNGVFITTANQPFTSALIMSDIKYFKYELIWSKTRNTHPFFAKIRPLPAHENILIFGNPKTYNPQKEKSADYKVNNGFGKLRGDNKGDKWNGESETRNEKLPKSVIQISNPSIGSGNLHPTQKPVALYEYLIKTYTNEGETVLDIAMGSGTTIEAAERTGRNSIGIEKDEGIFQSAVLRLKPFTPSNTACAGRLDSSATQSSFTAEGISPAKAHGAKRRQ